jgi:hypothetical protein
MGNSSARRTMIATIVGLALAGGGLAAAGSAHAAVVGTAATRTVLTTSPAAPVAGQKVNLRAVVKPIIKGGAAPSGTVTFLEGATILGTGPVTAQADGTGLAKLAIAFAAGNHSLTARYEGDATYASSATLPVPITVGAGAAKTVLTASSSPTPAVTGQKVFLRAAVKASVGGSAPTGSVTFLEGATVLGTGTLATSTTGAQVATLSSGFSAGTHSLTARYEGNATYAASTSAVATLIVGKATSVTTVTEAATPTKGKYAVSVAEKAVKPGIGVPSGVVTIQVDSLAPQSFALSSTGHAKLVLSLAKGTHTAKVSYAGSSNFLGSNANLTFAVA